MATPNLEEKAVEIISAIQQAAVPMAKESLAVTLQAIQVSALIDLILALIGVICIPLIWRLALPALKRAYTFCEEEGIEPVFWVPTALASVASAVIWCFCMFGSLLDSSNWLSVLAPQLQLAKMVLHKLT